MLERLCWRDVGDGWNVCVRDVCGDDEDRVGGDRPVGMGRRVYLFDFIAPRGRPRPGQPPSRHRAYLDAYLPQVPLSVNRHFYAIARRPIVADPRVPGTTKMTGRPCTMRTGVSVLHSGYGYPGGPNRPGRGVVRYCYCATSDAAFAERPTCGADKS